MDRRESSTSFPCCFIRELLLSPFVSFVRTRNRNLTSLPLSFPFFPFPFLPFLLSHQPPPLTPLLHLHLHLRRSSIGTTRKGIGPAYSSKASRSGLRVHHLYDPEVFAAKFRTLVEGRIKRYGHFEYDTEAEIERYKVSLSFPLFENEERSST